MKIAKQLVTHVSEILKQWQWNIVGSHTLAFVINNH